MVKLGRYTELSHSSLTNFNESLVKVIHNKPYSKSIYSKNKCCHHGKTFLGGLINNARICVYSEFALYNTVLFL